jgi:predicted aspartyl protease
MLRTLIFCFSLAICLPSCSKLTRAFQGGELSAQKAMIEIPIIKYKRLNFIEVKIAGESYTFFVDTGAPNIVSRELAEKLKLKTIKRTKTGDSQGNSKKTVYVNLPEITIGDFRFSNTAAMIADLSGTPGIQCLGIDGIIGSNLMQKAVWQFDFKNDRIYVARQSSDLPYSTQELTPVPFTTNLYKTPKFQMAMGGIPVKSVKLDTGSGNGIDINRKTFQQYLEKYPELAYLVRLGSSNYGIFGGQIKLDSTYHANAIPVHIAGQTYRNQNIRFQNNRRSQKIGMKFFEHFILTVNWFDQKMYLQEQQTPADTTYLSFGFSPTHRHDQLVVAALEKDGPADRAGIEIGDRVLSLDDRDCSSVTVEQWCEWLNTTISELDKDEVELNILKKNGKKFNVILERKKLL